MPNAPQTSHSWALRHLQLAPRMSYRLSTLNILRLGKVSPLSLFTFHIHLSRSQRRHTSTLADCTLLVNQICLCGFASNVELLCRELSYHPQSGYLRSRLLSSTNFVCIHQSRAYYFLNWPSTSFCRLPSSRLQFGHIKKSVWASSWPNVWYTLTINLEKLVASFDACIFVYFRRERWYSYSHVAVADYCFIQGKEV